MRDEYLYLGDIVDSAEAIQRYLSNIDEEKFLADEILQGAIMNKLTIIGEAASKISRPLRNKHPEINWKGIIALRNILVHAYFGLDMEIVWETSIKRVPILGEQVKIFLSRDFS